MSNYLELSDEFPYDFRGKLEHLWTFFAFEHENCGVEVHFTFPNELELFSSSMSKSFELSLFAVEMLAFLREMNEKKVSCMI